MAPPFTSEGAVVVRGRTLSLRYARADDAAALLDLGSDPEVTRFFSWGPYRTLAEPLRYIEGLAPQRERGVRLEFLIAGPRDEPIGVTGLSEFSLRDRRAVVGTWLGRAHWGTGANVESKALVLGLAFRVLGLARVTALANPANRRSVAALERLGFVAEGVLRAWHRHGGVAQDVTVLRLMREDYEAGPLVGAPFAVEGSPPPQFLAGVVTK
jgi:ribosomal-protein-alanine N-acetyltransferase